ncbi:MAG: type II toxin-antitoxin system HipA family toxin [Actinomycetaceae bacterium]|nr:type II toxin-antitoxin system HipA family toxin [Actinomycetaceae bacterium]
MGDLVVELYGTRIGVLRGDWRNFDFVPDRAGVARFGLGSNVLSLSVPLLIRSTRSGASLRRNFFSELLPEGHMRARLARNASVPDHDVIALLRHYGRDVAGALQIWDPNMPGEPREPRMEQLDDAGVAAMLAQVTDEPLGNKPGSGKTSLAGVQDKIVLARSANGVWNRVVDGAPSTHILKPQSSRFSTMIFDEEYGARLCRKVGLAENDTWVDNFDGIFAVVIERYDRTPGDGQGRIHQEDGNQILGAAGDEKYQRISGKVSLRRLAHTLASACDTEMIEQLLRYLAVAVAIGNLDMHTKNISVLHLADGACILAPAYDMVPQRHFSNDGELALAVHGKYQHSAITADDLIAEGESWGLTSASSIVPEILEDLALAVSSEQPHPQAHPSLVGDISTFIANLQAGKPVG